MSEMSVRALRTDRAARASTGTAIAATAPVRYLIGAIAMFIAALMVGPIVLSFLSSIKTSADALAIPPSYLPHTLSIENYLKVIHYQAGLFTYVSNSLIVALLTILFIMVLCVPAGYGLARSRFRGKEVFFLVLLLPLMIPYQALLSPLYLMFAKIGLANTYVGLAIVHTLLQLPFSVYLMRNSFEGVPVDLEEAGMIDGASAFQCFWRIALPLAVPGIITIALFAFIMSWNEFLGALVVMNREAQFTVPIMLVGVRTGHQHAVDWGALQAGIIVSIIPCVALYLFLQKYYISGLLSGAVK